MAHVADRILAAVLVNLAAVPGIVKADIMPIHLLDEIDLPAVVIDDIEDEIVDRDGFGAFPDMRTQKLKFVVQLCVMQGSEALLGMVAGLHEAVELALVGSESAIRLGGLLTRGLRIEGATMFADADSLQKPVAGWRISVSCTYNLSSAAPGKTEKE